MTPEMIAAAVLALVVAIVLKLVWSGFKLMMKLALIVAIGVVAAVAYLGFGRVS